MNKILTLTALLTVLLFARAAPAVAGAVDISMHEISVELSPEDHFLKAKDRITISIDVPGAYALLINRGLDIRKLSLDGMKIPVVELAGQALQDRFAQVTDATLFEGAKGVSIDFHESGKHYLEIVYEGIVYDTLRVPDYSLEAIPAETTGIISDEGVYLGGSAHWYPNIPDDLSFFLISIVTPGDFESVTEGKRILHAAGEKNLTTEWEAFYPTGEVTLVAGRYVVQEEHMDGIVVQAFFLPSEKELMPQYIEASRRYIEMYNSLIGPYPFSKFAIVENYFPTGYGMPSFTLLGRRVIRLSWIVNTSLGHEVAHNWWGNSVYPDYSLGNWCEGLTVYYADHRYKQDISDSAAVDYRRVLDSDYTSYVNEENDFPLSEFRERTTPGSRAIGYGKGAFVFHMLKDIVGEECFYRTLRTFYRDFQFKTASWLDIRTLFERLSGQDLKFFFDQWVFEKGAPEIALKEVRVDSLADRFVVRIRVEQNPAFRLLLPLVVAGTDTAVAERVWIASPETTLSVSFPFRPVRVSIDPGYDLFRRLSPLEIPPAISAVMGDPELVIVLPTRADGEKRAVFESLAAQLTRTGDGIVMEDSALTVSDLEKRSLLILGDQCENALLSIIDVPAARELMPGSVSVAGKEYTDPGHSAFCAFRSPFNPSKSIAVIAGVTSAAVEQAGYKIIHYGKYSFVVFLDGRRIEAGIVPAADNPMIRALDRE